MTMPSMPSPLIKRDPLTTMSQIRNDDKQFPEGDVARYRRTHVSAWRQRNRANSRRKKVAGSYDEPL